MMTLIAISTVILHEDGVRITVNPGAEFSVSDERAAMLVARGAARHVDAEESKPAKASRSRKAKADDEEAI